MWTVLSGCVVTGVASVNATWIAASFGSYLCSIDGVNVAEVRSAVLLYAGDAPCEFLPAQGGRYDVDE